MRPRTAVVLKQNVPGPGQYNASNDPVKGRPTGGAMSHSSRVGGEVGAKDIPGPGTYSQAEKSKAGPAFSFGTSSGVAQKKSDVPGPGTYKIPSAIADLPDYALSKKI